MQRERERILRVSQHEKIVKYTFHSLTHLLKFRMVLDMSNARGLLSANERVSNLNV